LSVPGLDKVLQMGPHNGRVEGNNHFPHPLATSSIYAAQDALGLLRCKHTLLAHVQLFIHQDPQVLHRAAATEFFP